MPHHRTPSTARPSSPFGPGYATVRYGISLTWALQTPRPQNLQTPFAGSPPTQHSTAVPLRGSLAGQSQMALRSPFRLGRDRAARLELPQEQLVEGALVQAPDARWLDR